jgi:hypothetical protein
MSLRTPLRPFLGIVAVALTSATVSGCNAGRAFVATPNDYADYRRVRLGTSLDERLGAAWDYLKVRPDGRYSPRVRAYFDSAEPTFFAIRRRSAAGLEAYVKVLPDGPHAAQALEELMGRRNETRREALAERATRATLLRVAGEGRARRTVASAIEAWVRPMLGTASWRGTFSDAPPDLLARFRLSAPEPACRRTADGQHCTKEVERTFRVRSAAGEVERTFALRVEIDLDAGYHLQELRLSGVGVARATEEARGGVALEAPRAEALAWHEVVERLGATAFADGRVCSGGEDAGGVWTLECDDPWVTLVATPNETGRETIVVRRRPSRREGSP